eukprot:g70696.t1
MASPMTTVTISGGGTTEIFSSVTASGKLTLAGLVLQGAQGAAIRSTGSLRLYMCKISGCNAMTVDEAAVVSTPNLDIQDSIFENNIASSAGPTSGALRINGPTGVTAMIARTTFVGNQARAGTGSGGAIYNLARLNLTDCLVSSNTAQDNGGGILNRGDIKVTRCTISGNRASTGSGGGMQNEASSTATILQSAFINNQAGTSGGGLVVANTALVTSESTFCWCSQAIFFA